MGAVILCVLLLMEMFGLSYSSVVVLNTKIVVQSNGILLANGTAIILDCNGLQSQYLWYQQVRDWLLPLRRRSFYYPLPLSCLS
jgi:hypothetical protein